MKVSQEIPEAADHFSGYKIHAQGQATALDPTFLKNQGAQSAPRIRCRLRCKCKDSSRRLFSKAPYRLRPPPDLFLLLSRPHDPLPADIQN